MKAPNPVTNYICNVRTYVFVLITTLFFSSSLIAQLAFPTATGAGAYVSGGRGYPVYKVTSLQDSGPGTFRQALLDCESNGGGNIVFDVSGTIILNGLLSINNLNNVTIAGQTAPEGGITIGGTGTSDGQWVTSPKILINNMSNVIWRYMRFRQEFVSLNHDNIIFNNANNYIIDHCSFAAGTDEGLDTTNLNDNFTVQNNLYVMCKTGNIVGSSDDITHASAVSFNRNMFYNTSHRFANGSVSGRYDNINNLVWNYIARICVIQGEIEMNHINNYYSNIYGELDNPQDGPSYALGRRGMLYNWDSGGAGVVNIPPSFYTAGNILEESITDPNADNWQFFHWRFNAPAISGYQGQLAEDPLPVALKSNTMFPLLGQAFDIRTAQEIKDQLPDEVGANARIDENGNVITDIDAVDQLAITNVKNNIKVYYNQGNLYDEHAQYIRDFWETFSTTPLAVRNDDTNGDGIPEAWANANMPDGAVHSDIANNEGYTYFELYINSVDQNVNEVISVTDVVVSPNNLTLDIGEVAQLNATVVPDNASNTTGSWDSNNTALATVDSNGRVTAVAQGQTMVDFTSNQNNNISDAVNVTVSNQMFGTYELYNADSDQLIDTIEDGSSYDITTVGDQINIRAIPKNGDASTDVESIRVDWTKSNSTENGTRIDNSPFYTALANSVGTDFDPYQISTGTYNFTITYYSEDDASGDVVAINTFSISFFDSALTASAGEDQTICEGEEVTLTATGGANYLWNTGETSDTITVSPVITTTYTVTVDDGNGNSDTDSVTVTVNETPELTITEDTTILEGESVTLTVQGASSFLWSTGDNTDSITVSPTQTSTYTVSGSNNGCQAAAAVTVFVIQELNADAGEDVTICSGEEVILTASGGINYNWSNGASSASIAVSPTETTTYTITVSDNYGNSDTDSVTVTVNDVPELTITENVTIMEGESVTLTVQGANDYLWSTGDTSNSITVSPTQTTTYNVTGTSNGCEDSAEVTVTVIPELNAYAGEDISICNGESVTLTATGGTAYTWNNGASTASITVSPTITTTYTVTVSDNFGNSESDSVVVNVNEIPIVTVTDDIEIVEGDSVSLTANGAAAYSWSNGANTATISVSPTQTTTYTVTGTTNSCSDTAEVTVTVIAQFEASAGADERVCDNYDYEVTLTANQGDSYLWSTGETTQSINVSPLSTTTYTVTVTQGIQEDTDDVTVYVDPNPNVVIVNGDSVDILSGDFITLSATGANSYEWNNGATQPNIAVSPSQSTTYSVRGYINDCYDEKEVTVNVFEPVVADAGEDKFICLDETTTLTATGGEEYLWSTGETTQSIQVSPTETTDYTVTVFNAVDFDEASVRVEVDTNCDVEPVIPEEQALEFAFDVFPNPAADFVNVKLSGTLIISDIYLYDFTGKLINQIEVNNEDLSPSTTTQIDVRSLNSGIYFVKLVDQGRDVTKKLIIN